MAQLDAPPRKDEPSALQSTLRWRRLHRFAAGLTHLSFLLLLLLAAVRADFQQMGSEETVVAVESLLETQQEPDQGTAPTLPEAVNKADGDSGLAEKNGRMEGSAAHSTSRTVEGPAPTNSTNAPEDPRIARLLAAYPDFLSGYANNELIWRDGSRMAFDDGRTKDHEQRLTEPDVEDMFAQTYPAEPLREPPQPNHDPGRVRHDGFFTRIYGDCRKGEVAGRLVDVYWLPSHGNKKIKVTSINGVAEKLQRVSNELDKLPERFIRYLQPIAGTFNCRNIARSDRLSAHSYGIAIDINAKVGDYWQWHKPGRDGLYEHRNDVPWEIAEIFEKHGFIWGAKWYHFDSFHFEYRPELLISPDLIRGNEKQPGGVAPMSEQPPEPSD